MAFHSDNTLGCSPEILEAVARAAAGSAPSYGFDPVTARLRERVRELFAHDALEIFPVLTGTAGNALAIAAMTPPWGAVFCSGEAHIHRDELGAPEFFSGGAKVIPIDLARLAEAIDEIGSGGRTAIPACLSLTNATESGTVYTPDALRELCAVANARGMRVHLDGARFANAVASCGASPAELSWRAGVDILVFGGTKNGALAAELIVVFDPSLARELALRWHRGGHRLSKMRFLSAQLEAYLADDLWLRNARRANAAALRLAQGLGALMEIVRPVEANVVFARVPPHLRALFAEAGYDWPLFGDDVYRLVTGFSTTDAEIDAFLAAAAR
jgi:threonine aldolase